MSPRRWGHTVASEKAEQALGERIMASLGFVVWRLSQARATHQTLGWCDVVFTAPGYLVAWEAKREGGKQRPHQRIFQQAWTDAGATYVLGPSDALIDWLVSEGFVQRTTGAGLHVLRRADRIAAPRAELVVAHASPLNPP